MNELVAIFPANLNMDRTNRTKLGFTIKNNEGYLLDGVMVTLSLGEAPLSGYVISWFGDRLFKKKLDDMITGMTDSKGNVVFELVLDKGFKGVEQGNLKSIINIEGELMINRIPYTIIYE